MTGSEVWIEVDASHALAGLSLRPKFVREVYQLCDQVCGMRQRNMAGWRTQTGIATRFR